MSKSNVGTIAIVAAAAVGGVLLLNKIGGIGKGIQDAAQTVTNAVDTVYNHPVAETSRTILDDAGILDKDNPVSTIAKSGSLATNPINRLFDIFGAIGSKVVTGVKENAADPAAAFKKEVKQQATSSIANPVTSIVNFFGGIFGGSDDRGESLTSNTVLKNGKLVEKDTKTKMIEKVSGVEVKEIVGAPSTLTKEEREKLPTLSMDELSQRSDFIGRTFKYIKDRLDS